MSIKIQPSQGVTVEEAFRRFIKNRRAGNLSHRTIKFYEENYKILTDFINPQTTCIQDINSQFLDDYILYLKDKGTRNSNSINTAIRALKVFLNFSMENELMEYFQIRLIKVDKEVKESYTESEIKKLVRMPTMKRFSKYRTWVMIQYMLMTGNRASTVVELKIKDVDFEKRQINIRKCKNRKGYLMPLNTGVEKLLKDYLNRWDHSMDDYLFPTQNGKAMTVSGLQNSVRRYCIDRGVSKTSVHLFRYSFARQYMKNHGTLERLSYMLGHSTIEMTKHYLNTSIEEVAYEYDNMKFIPDVEG